MKKFTSKLMAIMSCAIMTASSMVGMGASAKPVTNPDDMYHPSDFLQYTNVYPGEYSRLSAQVYSGTISSTNSNYNGSWKFVSYYTYTDDGGRYVLQGSGNDSGTDASVSCPNSQVNSATAKREYIANMRRTSSSTSTLEDTYDIVYIK